MKSREDIIENAIALGWTTNPAADFDKVLYDAYMHFRIKSGVLAAVSEISSITGQTTDEVLEKYESGIHNVYQLDGFALFIFILGFIALIYIFFKIIKKVLE